MSIFDKKTWKLWPSVETPLTDDGFNDLENRIGAAFDSVERSIDPTAAPYYAKGDGVTDDTLALQTAVRDAAILKRRVDVPGKSFVIKGNIASLLSSGDSLRIHGVAGRTSFIQGSDARIIDFTAGTKTRIGALTADVAAGATSLTLDTVAGLSPNDKVLIRSNRIWPGNDHEGGGTRPVYSETQRIDTIVGTTLTFKGRLEEYWWVDDGAEVWLLNPGAGVEITGISVTNSAPTTRTSGAIRLALALRPKVSDCSFYSLDGPAVQLDDCWGGDVKVHGQDLTNNPAASQFGYVVNVGGCSRGIQVQVTADKFRHAFTCNGNGATGVPRHIQVTGQATGGTNTAFDTHCAGRFIHFHDLEVFDSGQAVHVRALDVTVDGLDHVNCRGPAVRVSNTTGVPDMGCVIDNVRAVRCQTEALRILGNGVTVGDVKAVDGGGAALYLKTGTRRVSFGRLRCVRPGANRSTATTLSGSTTFPTATVNVVDASLFKSAGTAVLADGTTFTYTGVTGNQLTGCSGGSGTYAAGTGVHQFIAAAIFCDGTTPIQDTSATSTIVGNQTLPKSSLSVASTASFSVRGTVLVTNTAGATFELAYQSLGVATTFPTLSPTDLSASTLEVEDTSTFSSSGSLTVTITDDDTGDQTTQTLTYTGTTATQFTGVTGGSGSYDPGTITITQPSTTVLAGVQGDSVAHGTLANGSAVTQPYIPCTGEAVIGVDAERLLYCTGSNNNRVWLRDYRASNPRVTLDKTANSPQCLREIRTTVAGVDFPSIASGSTASLAVTVTGARVGDLVSVTLDAVPGSFTTGHSISGYVTSNDAVRLTLRNQSGATADLPASNASIITTAAPSRAG